MRLLSKERSDRRPASGLSRSADEVGVEAREDVGIGGRGSDQELQPVAVATQKFRWVHDF
jgi:hypothetical protein